jgi:putative hydrolase of the HAD superfamily
MPRVRAISFDLWDTVFIDDSDEPKRSIQGLLPKPAARRELVHSFLSKHAPIDRALVNCAYDTADASFREVWHSQHYTWPVAVRLRLVLAGLKRELPPEEFRELVTLHEEMELHIPPDLVPGIGAALQELGKRYRLVVVSDAIFTPGRLLREILANYGLRDYFSAFVFSDEAGCSKPHPRVFSLAAEQAGCDVSGIVHIGDREHNDIAGPKDVGARAVLLTAAIDRGSAGTRADAICRNYSELPAIIQALDID